MKTLELQPTINAWLKLEKTIFVPRTEEDYQYLVNILDQLIDEVGENESHPLASLMEIIGVLIENYESQNIPELS